MTPVAVGGPRPEPAFAGPERGPRFASLDGLRGLAILGVVFYHYYSRWPESPELYSRWFSKGYMGVQLFFLLSGYLICLTIERCPTYGHFLYRRWLRLFPAMLVASVLIVVSSLSLYRRDDGLPGPYDVLSGLLFIDPDWLRGLAHLPVTGAIEGDFWTLFTEVKFYALFGAAFFLMGRRAVGLLAGLALLGAAVWTVGASGGRLEATATGRLALFVGAEVNAPCYGWFAAGAFLYLYVDTRRRSCLAASAISAVLGILANLRPSDATTPFFLAAVYGLFIAPFFVPAVGRFFSHRSWVFGGFISYPLYLLHENAGCAVILALHRSFPGIPGFLLPLLPLSFIGFVSWLIAAFLEPLLRAFLPRVRGTDLQGRFTRPRLLACAAVALVAAGCAAAGASAHLASGRRACEQEILAADRAALEPLEAALARDRAALEDVRRSRLETERALEAIGRGVANP